MCGIMGYVRTGSSHICLRELLEELMRGIETRGRARGRGGLSRARAQRVGPGPWDGVAVRPGEVVGEDDGRQPAAADRARPASRPTGPRSRTRTTTRSCRTTAGGW